MNPLDLTTLEGVLYWLISNGGAMWVSTWIMSKIKQPAWDDDTKTIISFTIAGGLGLAAWGIGLGLRLFPQPTGDWRDWVKAGIGMALLVMAGGKVTYSVQKAQAQRLTRKLAAAQKVPEV